MTTPEFTGREMQIMSILWERGSATVAEVRERMPDRLAYTTVLTLLRILEDKGHVDHVEEGRAHRYRPLVDWRAAGRGELSRLLRQVFKGSPELLLTQLVSDRDLDPAELRRMRDLVDERLGDRDTRSGPAPEEPPADGSPDGEDGP